MRYMIIVVTTILPLRVALALPQATIELTPRCLGEEVQFKSLCQTFELKIFILELGVSQGLPVLWSNFF